MTGEQMCETIAYAHWAQTGREVDPRAIWDASPGGEIWPIVDLLDLALRWLTT